MAHEFSEEQVEGMFKLSETFEKNFHSTKLNHDIIFLNDNFNLVSEASNLFAEKLIIVGVGTKAL